MEISLRLKKIADNALKSSVLVDVGTDHAYLPIYLYKKKLIKKAIATDVSKGPVENAKKNVLKYGFQDDIYVRLGDGLKTIRKQDLVDTCVIAGMGGSLIVDILHQDKDLVDSFSKLILQPQKNPEKVRQYLHTIGFKIIKDEMFFDEDRIYTLIVAKKGVDADYNLADYLFGKFEIETKSKTLKEYISLELYKMEKVLKKINETSNNFDKIKKKYDIYKEVFKCL